MSVSHSKSYAPGPCGQVHLRQAAPRPETAAPPLFCFHMSPYSGIIYENWIAEMGKDRLSLAPDTPGFGMSDPPNSPPQIEHYAATMVQVIRSLGRAPVDLMGYHTGSMIAVDVARQAPDLVRKIVMISAPVFTEDELAELRGTYGAWTPDETGDFLVRKWKANRFWAMEGATANMTAENFPEAIRRPGISWWGHKAAFDYDLKAVLPQVSHPVLVLNPEDDLVEQTRAGVPLMNTATLHELPGWGHGFLDLHTAETAQIVRGFLDA